MIWRMRQVPASGAKVRPVRRAFWICAAMPTVNASTRRLGRLDRHLAAAGGVVDDALHHALDAGEVGGRQAGQRHLVVAGAAQPVGHHRAHLLGGALAHRAGDHARLAEAAAPGAAPEHLDVQPVVHHLGERHELVAGVGPVGRGRRSCASRPARGRRGSGGVTARMVAPLVGDLVHRRDVHALDVGQLAQDGLAAALGAARRLPLARSPR